MRIVLASKLLVVAFLSSFIFIPASAANTPVVRIIDKPHLNSDGSLRKNNLAQSLLPSGKLGKLIFTPPNSSKTYVIDAALIDEVQKLALSNPEKVTPEAVSAAENWLYRLKLGSADNKVVALAYGNPEEKLLKRIAPSELIFYTK